MDLTRLAQESWKSARGQNMSLYWVTGEPTGDYQGS